MNSFYNTWRKSLFFGTEMSSMINLKASRKTPTINISANPVTNVHVTNRGEGSSTMVHYPDPNQIGGEFVSVNPQAATSCTMDPSAFQSDDPEKSKLMRENAVLKLIIDIQHSNPLIVNKYHHNAKRLWWP